MRRIQAFIMGLLAVLLLTGCYNSHRTHRSIVPAVVELPDSDKVAEAMDSAAIKRYNDSLRFLIEHHYHENFNFVVRRDSLALIRQQPEEVVSMMPTDSFFVYRHEPLVVADIRIMPTDSIDSVWVSVARDQFTFGWIHESSLLPAVDPDDPISQFITLFSDMHVLLFLIVISLLVAIYLVRSILRKRSHIVHFNDIPSVYPTVLTLIVATAATLYASIQMFAPYLWRHFYFNPTLNPFGEPTILMLFLMLVWAMLIVALACAEVTRQSLHSGDALLYLMSLGGVCAVDYIVFSITTLYYVGYILLIAYFWFAIRAYLHGSHCRYTCGNCGAPMHEKGRCRQCGALNE